jgi:hypothetical protein
MVTFYYSDRFILATVCFRLSIRLPNVYTFNILALDRAREDLVSSVREGQVFTSCPHARTLDILNMES